MFEGVNLLREYWQRYNITEDYGEKQHFVIFHDDSKGLKQMKWHFKIRLHVFKSQSRSVLISKLNYVGLFTV